MDKGATIIVAAQSVVGMGLTFVCVCVWHPSMSCLVTRSRWRLTPSIITLGCSRGRPSPRSRYLDIVTLVRRCFFSPRVDFSYPGTGALDALLDFDQLTLVRSRGQAFEGFSEARVSFEPTYKYDKVSKWCRRRQRLSHRRMVLILSRTWHGILHSSLSPPLLGNSLGECIELYMYIYLFFTM